MLKRFYLVIAIAIVLLGSPCGLAIDIEGVQPAALDQPRVNLCIRREIKGKPLSAQNALGGLVGGEESTINVQAFLDTGASGIMISGKTADALGIRRMIIKRNGQDHPVVFHDIGIGGSDAFGVSEKLFFFMSPDSGEADDESEYTIRYGPLRGQISTGGGLIEMLTGGLDVAGMPLMKGKVIVLDPRPVNTFGDTIKVQITEPRNKQIPKTDLHVKLTYVDFKRFTRMEPATAEFPAIGANPMIGPDPTGAAATTAPAPARKGGSAVVARHNGKQIAGTWLLDTGAAASIISKRAAAQLGVTYKQGTEGSDSPKLEGVPAEQQFALSVGGVGGMKKSAGFFLDSLTVPTREGQPIVYKPAPVLVLDISVQDPNTKQMVTLDGVFGMNFMVASAFVAEAGLMPDIKNLTQGPFEHIVFDEPAGVLGLKIKM
jgi:hypothetical protein